MPTRLIDFDSLWTSDKLAACEESTRVEYTWLYGLADPNGSFELNLRAIWSKVSPLRPELTQERLTQVFSEFEAKGLLFAWVDPATGKRYGHWTGSERSGRLPPPSERHRYKKFAPPVPKSAFTEYEARFRIATDSRPDHDTATTTSRTGVGLEEGLVRKGDGTENGKRVGLEGKTLATERLLDSSNSVSEPFPSKGNQNPPQNYHCEYCDKGFPTAQELMCHNCRSRTRGGRECVFCHTTFEDFRSLKAHLPRCRNGSRSNQIRA
jgi:hypothetical protein